MVVIILIIACISIIYGKSTNYSVIGKSLLTSTVSLLPIHKHNSKQVCGNVTKNQARCLAEVSIGQDGKPLTGSPAGSGSYGPVQFHTAYNLPCTPGGIITSTCSSPTNFGPQSIAVVEAGSFSTGTSGLESSLQSYDQFYSLPTCTVANGCLGVINQIGSTSPLPADAGWTNEIALDVEAAHMICQTCKIIVVEANDNQLTNLAISNNTAAALNPTSISNSWGSTTDAPSLDANFKHPGIAEVASTGDSGTVSTGATWPSDIPEVVGAAGTTLQIQNNNSWGNETVWSGSGGGCSNFYSAPTWQSSLSTWQTNGCNTHKAFGDVAADADPNTGAAIYINGTWFQYGGTSLSSPIIASIFALSGGIPSGVIGASVPYSGFSISNFHDITSGNDCVTIGQAHCTAAVGFDTPTGLGSPNGIGGFTSMPLQPANLVATIINQNQINLIWNPSTASNGIKSYDVYKNGTKLITVTTTNFSDTGLLPNTTYLYSVIATDNSNNQSLASSTLSAISSYPADINQDSHINLLDLSILANKYGQSGLSLGRSDINRDGKVDLLDLSILAGQYGSE